MSENALVILECEEAFENTELFPLNAKAKLPGPPAKPRCRGKPVWRPRSASAVRSAWADQAHRQSHKVMSTADVPAVFLDTRVCWLLPSKSLTMTNVSVSCSRGGVGLSRSKRINV